MPRPKDHSKVENIYQAALQLVIRRGFNEFRMADVAKAAGVATGSLYTYFRNKEELVNALFLDTAQQLYSSLQVEKRTETTHYHFMKIWTSYYNYCFVHPDHMLFIDQYQHSGFLSDETKNEAKLHLKSFDDFLHHAQEYGDLRMLNLEVLKALILGSVHEFTKLNIEHPGTMDFHALETCKEMIWEAVKERRA
ncbi:MAG: TetR/AcrR family transcriptional regulator [Bacteroidetes bacterium]|nr:MAG: TetR/AcrR family transcriptional regulator [Bacteroidota bacterium]